MKIKVKMLRENAKIPTFATKGSAACDLYSVLDCPVTLAPGERKLIPTGLSIELPDKNYVAVVCARSGLAYKRGLGLANGIGVIDSDYRGELMVALSNNSDAEQTVENGERIAQLMILPVILPEYELADELEETARGDGGFGSTGTK